MMTIQIVAALLDHFDSVVAPLSPDHASIKKRGEFPEALYT